MEGVKALLKIEVKQNVVIRLSTREIFAYLSNMENMVEWCSEVVTARKTSPGETQLGTTVRSTARVLGRWTETIFEVIEFEPNRYFTIKSTSGVTPSLVTYQFEPLECGGVRVRQEVILHLSEGLLEHPPSVVISAVERLIEYDFVTLKEMLEARAPLSGITD